jgi:hypothetical protein
VVCPPPAVSPALHPTSASWLNLVEGWYVELTRKQIGRGTHRSTGAVRAAIRDYIAISNEVPRPSSGPRRLTRSCVLTRADELLGCLLTSALSRAERVAARRQVAADGHGGHQALDVQANEDRATEAWRGIRHRERHLGGVLGALRGCQARPEWRRPRWLSSLRTYLQQPTNPVTLRSWRAIDAVLPEIHRGQKASDDSRPCRVHQPAVIRLAAQEDGRH